MKKFIAILESLEDWVSGLLIAAGLGVLFLQVIMRYVLSMPTTWHDEIGRYLIIWGVLIGSAVAIRDNQHIKVDIFYKLLPKGLQKWVNVFAYLITMFFFAFMIIYGYQIVIEKFISGQNSTGGFPLWIIYLILPISGVLMIIRTIAKLIGIFINKHEDDGEETLLI